MKSIRNVLIALCAMILVGCTNEPTSLKDLSLARTIPTGIYNVGVEKGHEKAGDQFWVETQAVELDSIYVVIEYPDKKEEKFSFGAEVVSQVVIDEGFRMIRFQEERVTQFTTPPPPQPQMIEKQYLQLRVWAEKTPGKGGKNVKPISL